MADAPVAFLGRRGGPRSLVGHDGNTAVTRAKDEQQLCALVGVSCKPPYEVRQGPDAYVLACVLCMGVCKAMSRTVMLMLIAARVGAT